MKTSITNKASDATASSAVLAKSGEPASNVLLRDSGRTYAVNGNLDLTVDDLGGIETDFIALFNVFFDVDMTMTLYDSLGGFIESVTFTPSDWTGFESNNLIYEPTTSPLDLKSINITTTGATVDKYIGYIWVGDFIDFGCEEAIQPFTNSNDKVTITRANTPDVNAGYEFDTFNITTNKNSDYKVLRDKFRLVFVDGFGRARPFYFDNVPFDGELVFGNLDAPRVGYDFFYNKTSPTGYDAQATIGVREVR